MKRQSEKADGDIVLRGSGAQPVIPERDEESRRGSSGGMGDDLVAAAGSSGGVMVDEEAARRVAWIQHHLREGNEEEAYALGWDGKP